MLLLLPVAAPAADAAASAAAVVVVVQLCIAVVFHSVVLASELLSLYSDTLPQLEYLSSCWATRHPFLRSITSPIQGNQYCC